MQLHLRPEELLPGVSAAYQTVERKISEAKFLFGLKVNLKHGDITFWFNSESDRRGFVNRIVHAVNR